MNKVLVTGATSGLGRAIAESFLRAGKVVFLHGRSKKGVSKLLDSPNCHFFRQDLRDLDKLKEFGALVRRENIDCFISNAGVYSDSALSSTSRHCLDVLTTNLVAPVMILRDVYSYYRSKGAGTIVSINSLAGIHPNFEEAIYCASKFGLSGFVKSLQVDAHKHNVRILDYYPGAIKTRITRKRVGYERFIDPGEIADLILSNVISHSSFSPVAQELRRSSSLIG